MENNFASVKRNGPSLFLDNPLNWVWHGCLLKHVPFSSGGWFRKMEQDDPVFVICKVLG